MDFFDSLADGVLAAAVQNGGNSYAFDSTKLWNDTGYSEVILKRNAAYELNGTGFCLVTSKMFDCKTTVVGSELSQIKKDSKFARVAIVGVEDNADEQVMYDLIKKIEYVKYRFFPQGYMIRSASTSYKESVRVSSETVKNGISFERIGNSMIEKIMKIPGVKSVQIYFFTSPDIDYAYFESIAQKNRKLTETLNRVMNEAKFDCSECNLKPICDEVEGMRELHFKNANNKRN